MFLRGNRNGKICHKGKVYEGQHKGIIEDDLWKQVQTKLAEGRQGRRSCLTNSKAKDRMPLLGILKDKDGIELVANHSRMKGRRLDYYVSASSPKTSKDSDVLRYGAKMLEQAIGVPIIQTLKPMLASADSDLNLRTEVLHDWLPYVRQIQIEPGRIRIDFNQDVIDVEPLEIPFTMRRQQKELRLCIEGEGGGIDETLLGNIAKARALYEQTKKGADLKTAASELSIDREWARKLLPLAFASPSVIERALKGDLPARATAGWFAKTNLPGDFSEQRRLIDGLA